MQIDHNPKEPPHGTPSMLSVAAAVSLMMALTVTPSLAFDANEAVEWLQAANFTCLSGQNHDGEAVSESQIKEACIDVVVVTRLLSSNGYCYNNTDFEWQKCSE